MQFVRLEETGNWGGAILNALPQMRDGANLDVDFKICSISLLQILTKSAWARAQMDEKLTVIKNIERNDFRISAPLREVAAAVPAADCARDARSYFYLCLSFRAPSATFFPGAGFPSSASRVTSTARYVRRSCEPTNFS